ncbi:uncharacterized protein LOC111376436 [Olea europaea var. sylvestris]|uniref:uncharacterized protein LOC111376436 n=1 Tax=Olea europaea var. sylvestris TaxID=158386 RepID=UPI000C1D4CB8|nr:uncharacterized protein LOC111376436 [Olea europaea var. sylvestris]
MHFVEGFVIDVKLACRHDVVVEALSQILLYFVLVVVVLVEVVVSKTFGKSCMVEAELAGTKIQYLKLIILLKKDMLEGDNSVERAMKLGAKFFMGTSNPADAELWMKTLESTFDVIECSEDKKLRIAVFLLKGGAADWWISFRSQYPDPSIITWTIFKKSFFETYYPPFYRDAKQNEFLRLVQGSMLEIKVRPMVTAHGHQNFGLLLEAALRVEIAIHEGSNQGVQRIQGARQSEASDYRSFPQCQSCGKFHPGECLRGVGVCYQCGQMGHIRKDYPARSQQIGASQIVSPQPGIRMTRQNRDQRTPSAGSMGATQSNAARGSASRQGVQAGRSRTQGKVFTMTQQEAEESPDVVVGMLSIFGRNACSLIDLGATYSFISHTLASTLASYANQMSESLDNELVVMTPVGDSLLADRIYKDCGIRVNYHELKADLIPLDIHDFDVILGMDFLSNHRASIDCFRKEVVFRSPGELEIVLTGERRILPSCVIFVLDAHRMLKKGCDAYLTHVIDTQITKRAIDDISVAPYRMAPAELKELKVQLQDLVDKGFIRPSVSP